MRTSNLVLTLYVVLGLVTVTAAALYAKSYSTMPSEIELTGNRSSLNYEALPIKHLKIEGAIKVILTAGLPQHRIEADEALLATLTDQDPDPEILDIRLPDNVRSVDVTAYVSSPDLETISLSGSADIESSAPLNYRNCQLELAGNPRAVLEFTDANAISIAGSGGTNTELSGRVNVLTADYSGGNGLEARNLRARVVKINSSGSTDAVVYADSLLSFRASGAGEVKYLGDPKIEFSASGSASISALDN